MLDRFIKRLLNERFAHSQSQIKIENSLRKKHKIMNPLTCPHCLQDAGNTQNNQAFQPVMRTIQFQTTSR